VLLERGPDGGLGFERIGGYVVVAANDRGDDRGRAAPVLFQSAAGADRAGADLDRMIGLVLAADAREELIDKVNDSQSEPLLSALPATIRGGA
jgi:hypothetical protein